MALGEMLLGSQRSATTLEAGDVGVIDCIKTGATHAKRLADLGFVRGARVEMVRPGAPCILRIAGQCYGLGRGHQDSIALRCS